MSKSTNNTPEWLKNIQNESWLPELFISGTAIYFLSSFMVYLDHSFDLFRFFGFRLTESIKVIFALSIGATILQTMLILHFFLRGLWVGWIGISYCFPNGSINSNLNFRNKFKTDSKNFVKPIDIILKLEYICSSLFSFSFIVAFSFIGFFICYFCFNLILRSTFILSTSFFYESFFGYSLSLILGLFTILLFLDLFTLGGLKKIRYLNKLYFYPYKILYFPALIFLYENSLNIFISNNGKLRVTLLSAVFLIIGTTTNYHKYACYANLPCFSEPSYFAQNHIDDQREDHTLILNWSFESTFVTNNLRIFSTLNELESYTYIINKKEIFPKWIKYKHPITKQIGKISSVPLENFNKGPIELIISGEHAAHWRKGTYKWEEKFDFIKE
ncbi:MAG: hypothetical protein MK207_14010 [Saprospiraceae bacterium]|nr:hypothetical protein [Saprospiraceae bacterium]